MNDFARFRVDLTDALRVSGENILAESKRIFIFPKTGKFLELKITDKVKITFDKD